MTYLCRAPDLDSVVYCHMYFPDGNDSIVIPSLYSVSSLAVRNMLLSTYQSRSLSHKMIIVDTVIKIM